jgi:hypothetical protein
MSIGPVKLTAIAFAAMGLVDIATACSLYRSYEPFVLGRKTQYAPELDPAPDVRIEEIKRGHSMC